MERAEEEWGEWGTIYLDDGGRLLGTLQYGPSHLFPVLPIFRPDLRRTMRCW